MFKMLSFGLDAGFESFPPLVNGLVHNRLFQVSPDLNKSLLQFSQITGNRAAGTQPIPDFSSTMNPQLNAVHCVKNHFRRTYFDKFMPACLRGPVFYETQCSLSSDILSDITFWHFVISRCCMTFAT